MLKTTLALLLATVSLAHADDDPIVGLAVELAQRTTPDAKQVGDALSGTGDKTDWNVSLKQGGCYTFAVSSAPPVKKMSLYLWDPAGKRITDARGKEPQVALSYCAETSGIYHVQAKAGPKGEYRMVVFGKGDVGKMVAMQHGAAPPKKAAPDLGQFCDKTAKAAASGAKRVGEFFDGKGSSFGHDDRSDLTIQMDAGKCYWIVGCGEDGRDGEEGKIKQLYLYLWTQNDKRVSEAKSDNPNPMLGYCAKETAMFKVQAKVSGGSGKYKLAVYSK